MLGAYTAETALRGRDQISPSCTDPSDAFHSAFIGEKVQLRVRLASGDTYDANNLRVMTQDATGSKRILLDQLEEYAEYAAGGSVARYDHDPSRIDSLLGQDIGATKVHAVSDALGSVYALTNTSSAAVSSYGYDVYGQRTASAEGVATKFGFTGRVHDTSDEMYYRARYLDAGAGRFVSEDPWRRSTASAGMESSPMLSMLAVHAVPNDDSELVGTTDGMSFYGFVEGSPTNLLDPTGLRALTTGERKFLTGYFARSLDLVVIDIGASMGDRSWSPYGNRISLIESYFCGDDSDNEVKLTNATAGSVFAHEALHVWQRQNGRSVTMEGAALQYQYSRGTNVYAYGLHADPVEMLRRFVVANIEQQGQMFEDYVEKHMTGGDIAPYSRIAGFVRAQSLTR